jgi:hypothetical protein
LGFCIDRAPENKISRRERREKEVNLSVKKRKSYSVIFAGSSEAGVRQSSSGLMAPSFSATLPALLTFISSGWSPKALGDSSPLKILLIEASNFADTLEIPLFCAGPPQSHLTDRGKLKSKPTCRPGSFLQLSHRFVVI